MYDEVGTHVNDTIIIDCFAHAAWILFRTEQLFGLNLRPFCLGWWGTELRTAARRQLTAAGRQLTAERRGSVIPKIHTHTPGGDLLVLVSPVVSKKETKNWELLWTEREETNAPATLPANTCVSIYPFCVAHGCLCSCCCTRGEGEAHCAVVVRSEEDLSCCWCAAEEKREHLRARANRFQALVRSERASERTIERASARES